MLGDPYLPWSSAPGATAAGASLNSRWGSISGLKKKTLFFALKMVPLGAQ